MALTIRVVHTNFKVTVSDLEVQLKFSRNNYYPILYSISIHSFAGRFRCYADQFCRELMTRRIYSAVFSAVVTVHNIPVLSSCFSCSSVHLTITRIGSMPFCNTENSVIHRRNLRVEGFPGAPTQPLFELLGSEYQLDTISFRVPVVVFL